MTITNIIGFDEFMSSPIPNTQDLDHYGGLPLVALKHTTAGNNTPDSFFRTVSSSGRGWLEAVPSSGDRRTVTECAYIGRYSNRPRYQRRDDVSKTNEARYDDSSRRTPCLGLRLSYVYGNHSNDSRVRYYRVGFRLRATWLHTQPDNTPFLTLHPGMSVSYRTDGVTLFTTTELYNARVGNEVYVELEFDTYSNRVRKWLNNEHKGYTNYSNWTINSMGLQWGAKSTELGGYNYGAHTQYYSCASERYTGTPTEGAPPDLEYQLTDFYFQVDTRDIETTSTHNQRLGDIKIHTLNPRQLQLAPGWTPNPSMDSLSLVERPRRGAPVNTASIHGDVDATDATVTLDVPTVAPVDEVIYTELSVWASPANVAEAVDLKIKPMVGAVSSPVETIVLPGVNDFQPRDHYVAHRIESVPLDPGLEKTTLGRLQFKLGFDSK